MMTVLLLGLLALSTFGYSFHLVSKTYQKVTSRKTTEAFKFLNEVLAPFEPQKFIEAMKKDGKETEPWMLANEQARYLQWQKARMPEIESKMKYLLCADVQPSKVFFSRLYSYQVRIDEIRAS